MIPKDLLLTRSIYHLEMAELQLTAGKTAEAADSIEKGINLIKEALG